MPTKSAVAWAGSAAASAASGEPGPKKVAMLLTRSRTVLSSPIAPKLQPARVKGTHGAGAFLPSALSTSGCDEVVPSKLTTRSVQYAKERARWLKPFGV